MRHLLIIIGIALLQFSAVHAQTFKLLRQDDDFSFLRDSTHRSWYDGLKYSPLNKSGSNYLSIGGEVRYQYFRFNNEDWGDAPDDHDGFILNRLLFHTDLHLGERFRIFGQLQSSISVGRVDPPSPVELDELELHQIFADYKLIHVDHRDLTFRVGRQEMSYGSSRLVSPREGPNNRQSFDGAKLFYKASHFKVDAFYSTYVAARQGIFNDDFLKNGVQFGGVYAAFNEVPFFHNIDVYYLVQKRKNASWNDVTGRELRHSVGTRVAKAKGRWLYDFEGIVQFGDLAGRSIRAWTMSSNMSYRLFAKEGTPSVGLKTELISGDAHAGDDKIQSFNPLYPKGAYFGYAALIGPSNLFDIHPSIDIPLSKTWELGFDYDLFRRFSDQDGIYNPGARSIYPSGGNTSKSIGHQFIGALEYAPNKFVYFRAEFTYFKSSAYLKEVGSGKDIFYSGITSTFKF